jgi:hypothetical protein
MSGLLFLVVIALAASQSVCNSPTTGACYNTYSWGLGNFSLNPNSFADPQTALCILIRDYIACLIQSCQSNTVFTGIFQQAYESILNECGFAMPGSAVDISGTSTCELTGDPHVQLLSGANIDCNLTDPMVVIFDDGVNRINVTSDADVSWPDKSLTAVRNITISNSRTGSSFTYHADPSKGSNQGDFPTIATTNNVTWQKNFFFDGLKKLRVRIERFSNEATPTAEYWINVYIRGLTTATGVCKTGCPGGVVNKRSSLPFLRQATTICNTISQTDSP